MIPWGKEEQKKIKRRSKEDQKKIKRRSKEDQKNIKRRSKEDQKKIKRRIREVGTCCSETDQRTKIKSGPTWSEKKIKSSIL